MQVIVVDNASTDSSAAMVGTEFLEVELVANSENVGFGRANNQVLEKCHGRYLLLLNPDTQVLEAVWKFQPHRLGVCRTFATLPVK
jgi:GT2 family glycosyltransferase